MTTAEDILARVTKCISEVLALGQDDLDPRARLTTDLGADSLDLVDLMYHLEEEFGIVLDESDLSISAQLGIPEEDLHREEVLTPHALELLRDRFPWAKDILLAGTNRRQLASLLTIEEVARSIERKVGQESGDSRPQANV